MFGNEMLADRDIIMFYTALVAGLSGALLPLLVGFHFTYVLNNCFPVAMHIVSHTHNHTCTQTHAHTRTDTHGHTHIHTYTHTH